MCSISGCGKDCEALNLTTLDKPRQSNGCSAAAALCLRRQPEANDGGSQTKVRLRRGEVVGLTSAWFMKYCASWADAQTTQPIIVNCVSTSLHSLLPSLSGSPYPLYFYTRCDLWWRVKRLGGGKDCEPLNQTTLDKPRQSNGCNAAAALCLHRQPEANDGGSQTKVRLRREEVMSLSSAWFMKYSASWADSPTMQPIIVDCVSTSHSLLPSLSGNRYPLWPLWTVILSIYSLIPSSGNPYP